MLTNREFLYRLFLLPDVKISGTGDGIISKIEAGGFMWNCLSLTAEEALISAYFGLSELIAEKRVKDELLQRINAK
jgi:hypothetical protein